MGAWSGRLPGSVGTAGDSRRSSPSVTSPVPRKQLAGIQRLRLLAGAAGSIDEFGYAATTIKQITGRAGVSRRTFYELFGDRETCMMALLESILGMIEDEIRADGLDGAGWRERVRGGLGAILCFFDREPALARICVVQALRGGPKVLERRAQILARLASVIDEGRGKSARADGSTALTAEGLVWAAFGIVYTRLLRGERRSLVELEGELMSVIVLPYLGPATARRELVRPRRPRVPSASRPPVQRHRSRDPLVDAPVRLTFRTARVLDCIAEMPGACNREVGKQAGVADQGQISKLLARLERLDLIENSGEGHAAGTPNAWSLTATGRRVAQSIRTHTRPEIRGQPV